MILAYMCGSDALRLAVEHGFDEPSFTDVFVRYEWPDGSLEHELWLTDSQIAAKAVSDFYLDGGVRT